MKPKGRINSFFAACNLAFAAAGFFWAITGNFCNFAPGSTVLYQLLSKRFL